MLHFQDLQSSPIHHLVLDGDEAAERLQPASPPSSKIPRLMDVDVPKPNFDEIQYLDAIK